MMHGQKNIKTVGIVECCARSYSAGGRVPGGVFIFQMVQGGDEFF